MIRAPRSTRALLAEAEAMQSASSPLCFRRAMWTSPAAFGGVSRTECYGGG